MRQYRHWIESIEYGSNIIDDPETMDSLLDKLSSDDIIRDGYIDAVLKYINESVISVIGIPVFDCPACNMTQENTQSTESFKNIIPLDVISVFFGLLTQRLERMMER